MRRLPSPHNHIPLMQIHPNPAPPPPVAKSQKAAATTPAPGSTNTPLYTKAAYRGIKSSRNRITSRSSVIDSNALRAVINTAPPPASHNTRATSSPHNGSRPNHRARSHAPPATPLSLSNNAAGANASPSTATASPPTKSITIDRGSSGASTISTVRRHIPVAGGGQAGSSSSPPLIRNMQQIRIHTIRRRRPPASAQSGSLLPRIHHQPLP